MDHETMLDEIQECIDAMMRACQACKDGDATPEEMWADIEAASQDLAQLYPDEGEPSDDDEDDEDRDDDADELDFDADHDDEEGDDFDDDDGVH